MILTELLKFQKCQVPSKSQRSCLQGSPWKPESSSPKESCICTENACEGFRVFRNAEVFNLDYRSRSILVSCDRVDEAADVCWRNYEVRPPQGPPPSMPCFV